MSAPAVAIIALTFAFAPAALSAQTATSIGQSEKTGFYADVKAKRYDSAVTIGAAYHKLMPGDERFSLDYAYALLDAHRTEQATALLDSLTHARDATVRASAKRQLAAQAPVPGPPAVNAPAVAAATPPPFTSAYEQLSSGDLKGARDAFQTTLQTHPDEASAWRQLAYIDHALDDHAGAVTALDRYIALRPDDDGAKLDRAYELASAGNAAQARSAFVALQSSSDPKVADTARRQVTAMAAGKPVNFETFGYAENESRFHDTFYGLDARYYLAHTRIQPYIALHFSNDFKAGSVPASTILNDDAIVLSLGLRTPIAKGVYAFIEAGQAQSLLTGISESDLRYGLQASERFGSGGMHSQTEFDASLARYSRYTNTIGYAQVAHDFYIGSSVVRGVVGGDLALDTNRAFYNNVVDGFAGLQVRRGTATLRVIGLGGDYLSRGISLPAQRTYTSVNVVLLFGYSH
jgi:tetratricopeptide (TPR) repeat protein